VARAFEFAHEADPDAELYYNDFNLEKAAKRAGVIKPVQDLQTQTAHRRHRQPGALAPRDANADSWLNRGRMNYPLLWDRRRRPKPAFDAVVEALRNAR
jgi:GH35 family endo-1,4-beta-xylanase